MRTKKTWQWLFITTVTLAATAGCNNPSGKPENSGHADTATKPVDTSHVKTESFHIVFSANSTLQEIGAGSWTNDSAIQMRDAYRKLPAKFVLTDSGKLLQGVVISKDDFDKLRAGNFTRIMIEIGLKNLKDTADLYKGIGTPDYSVMIVPLMDDSSDPATYGRAHKQTPDGTKTKNYIAYDYGCPCPGSSCCPKD